VIFAVNVAYSQPGSASKIEIPRQWRKYFMRPFHLTAVLTAGIVILASVGSAQNAPTAGPYKVLKTVRAGGVGGFDYISADAEGRRLYIPRSGAMGQLTVFNLDTLEPAGTIDTVKSGGAVVDPKSGHGFSTTKPITMWDMHTLQVIKTIDVDSRPDGIMFDPFNERIWVLSHTAPYATVIDAKEGTVVGTVAELDARGTAEQAVSDGKGTVYVNVSDKGGVAVVDAKSLKLTHYYDVSAKGVHGSGMAYDAKNHVIFAYMRDPAPVVVILNADNGNIITTLPTGAGVDTVAFNPATMEVISGEAAGTMTIIKEESPTNFVIEQTLKTMVGAKTIAFDSKTGHVLTMAAEYGTPPADAPSGAAGRGGRGPMIPGSFSILMVGR
jgi:hypothetical protein